MRWGWYILLSILLLASSACEQNKTSKLKNELDSISNAIDAEMEKEEKLRNVDSAKFTEKDWQAFEAALNNVFKADIYAIYSPYELLLDSIANYDFENAIVFSHWLDELTTDNKIEQLSDAAELLPLKQADSLQLLVAAFTTVVKASNKTAISKALAKNIEKVVTSKVVSPNSIIEGIKQTLGENNFDRKLCRLSAICYLISMTQISSG